MKDIVIIALSVLAISWIPSVSADQSPESVVTCQIAGGRGYVAIGLSVATGIKTDHCYLSEGPRYPELPCSQCITSLEDQGCKTVSVDTGVSNGYPIVTYFLSCSKP